MLIGETSNQPFYFYSGVGNGNGTNLKIQITLLHKIVFSCSVSKNCKVRESMCELKILVFDCKPIGKAACSPPETLTPHEEKPCCLLVTIQLGAPGSRMQVRTKLNFKIVFAEHFPEYIFSSECYFGVHFSTKAKHVPRNLSEF